MIATRSFFGLLAGVVAFSLVGCGESKPVASQETMLVGLVSGVSDAANNATRFPTLFADGAAPKATDRVKYTKKGYELKESSVSGDSATMTVTVRDVLKGTVLGDVQWTATKTADGWKLTAAPLP